MSRGDVRTRLLDSAEEQFAQRGYHGVSMRQVAEQAGASVSLAQYHFTTKEALFSAVMERRMAVINIQRLAKLDQVEVSAAAGTAIALEDVVRAFIEPAVLLSRDKGSGGHFYAQLVSQVTNDPQPHARNVSKSFTDPIARQTLRVLQLALPDLDRGTLTWCYIFSVGAMISAISPTGRAKLLSNGECDPDDVNGIVSVLVPFLTGAIERIAALARGGMLQAASAAPSSSPGAQRAAAKVKKAPAASPAVPAKRARKARPSTSSSR